MKNFWKLGLQAVQRLGFIESIAEKSFVKFNKKFKIWILKVSVLILSVFMSIALLVLGLLFIVIDQGGIPRGVVFACGGLLGLMVLMFVFLKTK